MPKSSKDEEIKVRVPSAMKQAVQALASRRYTSESEIARQALLEYIEAHTDVALRETPVRYGKAAPNSAPPASRTAPVVEILKRSRKQTSPPK